ncbi:Methanogenesis regulatory protein FilR1 [uncultured archaeon]|nr:Methanogenesis regulatory protein FilR1 [uncultured archaeon]
MRKKLDSRDLHRLVICSDLRKNLLMCLNEDKKSLGDLRNELDISSTTAIHALRELEKSNLVFQDKDKNYALTKIGRILILKVADCSNAVDVIKKHERFWLEHDLSGIPGHLMEKIGWLKDSNIVQIDSLDIVKTHESFVRFIKPAKWLKGVSPIFSADYPVVFKEMIERNVNTQAIVTNAVLKKTVDAFGKENFDKLISKYQLDLSVIDEDLKVAFTVTDGFLSVGLFTNNGLYDPTHDLISTDDKAIQWGIELFEYYRKKAKKYEN